MNVDGLCLAAIGCAVLGVASPNPFGIAMKEMVPGASDQWSVEPLPPMHPSQWHLDRPRWNEKFKEWLPDPLARYEMDGPEISCKKIDGQWAIYYGGQELQCEECQGGKVISYFITGSHGIHDSERKAFNAMYGKDSQYIDTKKINEVAKSMNSKFLEVA